jgi:hypothetical protein
MEKRKTQSTDAVWAKSLVDQTGSSASGMILIKLKQNI